MPLVMGIGLLFRLDDSCRAKHAGERHVRAAGEESGPHVEDKFDTVADLPGAIGSDAAASSKSSSSNKKKASGASSSNKKKAVKATAVATPADDDFDVTSNLSAVRPAAGAVPIGRLTSEDEGTDAEDEDKRARLAQLAAAPPADQAAKPAGKKKMSAAERKRLKKGTAGQPSAAEQDDEEEKAPAAAAPAPAPVQDDSSDDEDWGPKKKGKKGRAGKKAVAGSAAAAAPAPAAATAAAPPKPLPRGKRNKLKRTAARYANQDEEDLVLAASLLGLQNVDKKKEEVKAREKLFQPKKDESGDSEGSSDEDEDEEGEKTGETATASASVTAAAATAATAADNDDAAKVCFGCKQRGHIFALCPNRGGAGDLTFAQARRAAETAEESEVQQLMAEEGVVAEDSEEAAASGAQAEAELNGLTGRPLPDDLLHFALPVCAPYDALSSYKYKLKLMPGAVKKGRAAKQAMSLFMQNDKVTHAEKELLKLVPEQELINVFLSNIKLSAPGQQDGKKKTKNKTKGKADE